MCLRGTGPSGRRQAPARLDGFLDRELGDGVDDPIEVRLPDRMHIGVRRRVHEVDRVGNAVLDRELHGVEVVAERAAQRPRSRARRDRAAPDRRPADS